MAAAAVAAGGGYLAAQSQQDAAGDAVAAQQQQFNTSQANQLAMYNQVRTDLSPYNNAGMNAVNALQSYWGLGQQPTVGQQPTIGQQPQAPQAPQTPQETAGMIAARAAGPHSKNGVTDGVGGFLLDGGAGLFRKNASPIQDIAAALNLGRTITDSQWAQAGYGPGGADPRAPAYQPQPAGVTQGAAPQGGAPQSIMGGGGAPTAGSAANAFDMLKKYPGYQFQYDQGLQGINRNLAAGGRFTSGAQIKDAQIFGQGQAENSVTNYLQMLQYLGSLGQSSAAGVGNAGMGMANAGTQAGLATGQGVAQSLMSGGSAGASGISNAAGQLGSLLNSQTLQSLFNGNGYNNANGGMYNGSYLAPFNSSAAAMGW